MNGQAVERAGRTSLGQGDGSETASRSLSSLIADGLKVLAAILIGLAILLAGAVAWALLMLALIGVFV